MREITLEKEKKNWLSRYDLENILPEEALQCVKLLSYDTGDYVVEVEGTLKHLLFLVKGETKVFMTLENGKSYLLRTEKPLQIYGDVEVLRGMGYVANVEALSKTLVLAVPIGVVEKYCLNYAPFLRFLVYSLSDRLIRLSQTSTDNILMPLRNKLAGFILLHMEKTTGRVQFNTTYTAIAEQLGTTYRHLSRTLKTFDEDGLIKKSEKEICVLKHIELRKIAGDTYQN